MGAMVSQITSLTRVYSTIYSGADQIKHQSSASLAFVRGIHRWPVNSPHKWPVTREMFPFDDVIMLFWCPNSSEDHQVPVNLPEPDIQISYRNLTKWQCTRIIASVMADIPSHSKHYLERHSQPFLSSDSKMGGCPKATRLLRSASAALIKQSPNS